MMTDAIISIILAGALAILAPVTYKLLRKRIKRKWLRGVLMIFILLVVEILLGTVVSVLTHKCSHDPSESPSQATMRDSIAMALDYQMEHYPASQYRDVYKNFMQDFFGPGHILADTAASGRYLRHELSEEGPFEGPLYEETGYKGNFYRVNLSLLKDGTIPYDTFFPAFVESVQGIVPPTGEEWMKTWNVIDSVISEKGLRFADEETDRRELGKQFAEGNYIAHHSRRFNDSVHFHYRIISRDNFERILLPLIEKKNE